MGAAVKVIQASVGLGGANRRADVVVVQRLLNEFARTFDSPLEVTGFVSADMIARIEALQKSIVRMTKPDDRIEPDGDTLRRLLKASNLQDHLNFRV